MLALILVLWLACQILLLLMRPPLELRDEQIDASAAGSTDIGATAGAPDTAAVNDDADSENLGGADPDAAAGTDDTCAMMGGIDIAAVDEANPGDPRGAAAAAATGASSMIDPGAAGADAEAATVVSDAEAPSAETSSCSTTPVTGSRQTSFPMKSLQTLELPQSAKQIRFLNINEK